MKRDWNKYIKKNKPGHGDCQLVSALNAYYFLTGRQYCTQDSDEYDELVKITRCRHGTAINIEKAHRKLGLDIIWSGNSLFSLMGALSQSRHRKKGFRILKGIRLPIEWNVWEWGYGYHSTLIVNQEPKTRCVRVTNFDKVTTPEGWMFEWDMHKYESYSTQRDHKLFRLFALRGKSENKAIKLRWRRQQKQWAQNRKDHFTSKGIIEDWISRPRHASYTNWLEVKHGTS